MSRYDPEDYKFETLREFKFYLSRGANVGFEYNGVEYGIESLLTFCSFVVIIIV